MQPEVTAALVAAVTATVTTTVGVLASHRRIIKVLRDKRLEEISEKQLRACEEFWALLLPVSMSHGEGRVVRNFPNDPVFDRSAAMSLVEGINRVFNQAHGLYTSRKLRSALFRFRDFLERDLTAHKEDGCILEREEAIRVLQMTNELRIALREEIGVRDPNF